MFAREWKFSHWFAWAKELQASMKRVLIIEAEIKQYRIPLYAMLRDALRDDGIQLTVAYSDPGPVDLLKKDSRELPPEYGKKVRGHWFWAGRLLYQPLLILALRSDMVIVNQENKFLLNHVLLPLSRMGLRRVAFWGHGENHWPPRIRLSEWYRRRTLNWVSWWFAYTKGTAKYLESQGVAPSKITVVQNAVDTREIRDCVQHLSREEKMALRTRLGIPEKALVGIFCGAFHKEKGIRFLIESSRIIKERVPGFELILVGAGPDQGMAEQLARGLPWIHVMGPRFGIEKARLLAVSDVFLLPGAVGLAIVDAFAAGLPMLTIRLDTHGPEIEYVDEGVNGLICDPNVHAYAEAVSSLLVNADRMGHLRAGAAASSQKHSIENMVENFKMGIEACLNWSSSRVPVRDADAAKNVGVQTE